MQIVHYPHPALRRVSKPVAQVNDEIRHIARDMLDLMHAANGIGLAANQVAIPLQLFVLGPKADSGEAAPDRVFINPRILERKGIVEEEEGCLSLPGLYGKLKRAERVRVRALELNGEPFDLEAEGLMARAIQHEFDHLQGILFIDKLGPLAKLSVVAKIKEFERNYRRGQEAGEIPPNPEIERVLVEIEATHG
jgi:peptide deformylase